MYEKTPPTLQEVLLSRKAWLKFELQEVDRLLKLAYPKYDPRANGSTEPEPTPQPAAKGSPGKFLVEQLSKITAPVTISSLLDTYAPGLQGNDRSKEHSKLQSAMNVLVEKGTVKEVETTEGRSKYAYELVKIEPE